MATEGARQVYVALLYSIVLGPGRRLLMADLKALARDLGLDDPRTVSATGNLVFSAPREPRAALEERIERAFASRFGKAVPVILREAEAWQRLVAANPFPEAAAENGARVHVRVMRKPASPAELERLQRYAGKGEAIRLVDGDIFVHFADALPSEGRLLGQFTTARGGVGTMRNWNTVLGIAALLAG